MFTLFNGGKAQLGCTVKFAKFYLIVDCLAAKRQGNEGLNLHICIQKFITALNKALSVGKSGAAAFKPNEEGSYFNAFPTINETLKQIEEAIVQSGANGLDAIRPGSVSGSKPETAGSKMQKTEQKDAAKIVDGNESKQSNFAEAAAQ